MGKEPNFIKKALEILENNIEDEGLERKEVYKLLKENEFDDPDIEYILERLISQGDIYEVDETIYITDYE